MNDEIKTAIITQVLSKIPMVDESYQSYFKTLLSAAVNLSDNYDFSMSKQEEERNDLLDPDWENRAKLLKL